MTSLTFSMEFQPTTIQHLGLRLYSTLPPVISELVSNAYDAESPLVEITLPTGPVTPESEVVVRDFGHGMDATMLQEEYLPIGRNRRGTDSTNVLSKNGKRRVTGRKGLGKLAAFGVASEMEITAFKDGSTVCVRLNYDDMLQWANIHGLKRPYEPTVVAERTGQTSKENGVEVRIRKFHRKRAISVDVLRKGLAQRLALIGRGFEVRVNGSPIAPTDRMQKSMCDEGFSWDVNEMPGEGKVLDGAQVKGWMGFVEESSQSNRGIDVFANGKAVELGSFFNYASTHAQFARAHLVGEVHADFLDEHDDNVATARNSVLWESEAGAALQDWGQGALKWVFGQWVELRRKEKETKITKAAGFDIWIKTRSASEQRVAHRMLKLLSNDPNLAPASAVPILEIVKSSVETVAFHELIDAIEAEGTTPAALLRLFDEWRVIEAREHLKLADGRVEAMEKLAGFIESGALEVQQIQPLIEKNLWLIDQAWTEANGQTTYTEWLRKNCPEPKDYEDIDRRLDIMGVRASRELCILELKRPEKTLSRRDLEQIERYVDWGRNQFSGTGPDSPAFIHGLLVVGKLSQLGDVQRKQERLAGSDIRVETYKDILSRAREYYGSIERQLEKVAPEYARSRRKSKAKDAKAT